MKHLKKTRVILALIVFVIFLLLFLDVYDLVAFKNIEWITDLQIVPAVMQLSLAMTVSIIILTFLFFITLFFRRVYCSTLCPLGIFQDIIIRIKKWIKPKTRFKYHKSSVYVHYGIMALTFGTWIFGSVFLISLLDPYSNFGRITGSLFKPVL